MTAFKQVIVVEGRDDTKRLQETFGAIDTIETRGSAIDKDTLALIKKAQKTRGVIVLTDPDFPGEKIRKTISQAVPGVSHAFIRPKDGVPDHQGSLGVEHASGAALKAALAHLMTEVPDQPELISQADLLDAGLVGGPKARKRRERLGELLHIGYVNGKQLQKRLALFQVSKADFDKAAAQVSQEVKD